MGEGSTHKQMSRLNKGAIRGFMPSRLHVAHQNFLLGGHQTWVVLKPITLGISTKTSEQNNDEELTSFQCSKEDKYFVTGIWESNTSG